MFPGRGSTLKRESNFIIRNMDTDIQGFISLQGSIGAGKSKFLAAIRRNHEKHSISVEHLPRKVTHDTNIRELVGDIHYRQSISSFQLYQLDDNNEIVPSDSNEIKGTPLVKKDYFLILDEPTHLWSEEIYTTAKYQEVYVNDPSSEGNDDVGVFIGSSVSSSGTSTPMPKTSMLNLFYSDMEKYGFQFQIHAFTTRLKLMRDQMKLIREHDPSIRIHVISERSLRTDKLFFYNLYKGGYVTSVEWENYNQFHTLICEEIMKMENIMIYIRTDPTKCLSRIHKRNRSSEMIKKMDKETVITSDSMEVKDLPEENDTCGISLDYLNDLHSAHDLMISDFKKVEGNIVFEVDFNDDMDDEYIDSIVSDLMSKIIEHMGSMECV